MPKAATQVALTKEQMDSFRDIAGDLLLNVRSYSGRAMHGATCLAVDGDVDMFTFGLHIGMDEELSEIFARHKAQSGIKEGASTFSGLDHFPSAEDICAAVRKAIGGSRNRPLIMNLIEFKSEEDFRSFMGDES